MATRRRSTDDDEILNEEDENEDEEDDLEETDDDKAHTNKLKEVVETLRSKRAMSAQRPSTIVHVNTGALEVRFGSHLDCALCLCLSVDGI
jgi:hypothetical protein